MAGAGRGRADHGHLGSGWQVDNLASAENLTLRRTAYGTEFRTAFAMAAAEFEPKMSRDEADSLYDGWKRAVERAKGWRTE
mgnify:CR=1 FL=1